MAFAALKKGSLAVVILSDEKRKDLHKRLTLTFEEAGFNPTLLLEDNAATIARRSETAQECRGADVVVVAGTRESFASSPILPLLRATLVRHVRLGLPRVFVILDDADRKNDLGQLDAVAIDLSDHEERSFRLAVKRVQEADVGLATNQRLYGQEHSALVALIADEATKLAWARTINRKQLEMQRVVFSKQVEQKLEVVSYLFKTVPILLLAFGLTAGFKAIVERLPSPDPTWVLPLVGFLLTVSAFVAGLAVGRYSRQKGQSTSTEKKGD